MNRFFRLMLSIGSSRAVPPVVIGLFFLIYIAIAFFTEEALITLIALTARIRPLAALLALIPLSFALRLVWVTLQQFRLRAALRGKTVEGGAELFDETVELAAEPNLPELEARLASEGYRTRRLDQSLAAWRGVGSFPARLLLLAGLFSLFSGILISVTTKSSARSMVIEGEPFPGPEGPGGIVERITLANAPGPILARTLTMEIAPAAAGQGNRSFGIYPPSLYRGRFVYFRYLGIGLHLRFTAPDLPAGYDTHSTLNLYPPGREDGVPVPGSPYRLVFSIPEPEEGGDRYLSYVTGKPTLRFKVQKGKEVVLEGSAAGGGEFGRGGYRVALPEVRRLVVTDFIGDYGVLFIWATAILLLAAVILWLPIRLFFPRREMLFLRKGGSTAACSRSEGKGRAHGGVFHEALDLIDASGGQVGGHP